MILFDRQGNQFDFATQEVPAMLATGVYFENPGAGSALENLTGKGKMITIYEKATGKALKRRPIDAHELVKTGKYATSLSKPGKQAKPDIPQLPQGAPPSGELPVLTEENSKQEIIESLQKYGIQFRVNMDKESLLALWNSFLIEQGQK